MPACNWEYGDGNMIKHVPGSDVAAGDVVVVGDKCRIARSPFAANSTRCDLDAGPSVYTGIADGAIGDGKDVYWDATTKKVTLTSVGNKRLGVSASASAANNDPILFILNGA